MNGYDVARALRRDFGNGKMTIRAVSGYGADEDRRQSSEAGFDAQFVKPVEVRTLEAFLDPRGGA